MYMYNKDKRRWRNHTKYAASTLSLYNNTKSVNEKAGNTTLLLIQLKRNFPKASQVSGRDTTFNSSQGMSSGLSSQKSCQTKFVVLIRRLHTYAQT